jgi:dTDP-4-dehydrorhamnose reductase
MRRLAGERDEVTVVDDQVGTPTFTGHLAEGLLQVAEQRTTGVLHAHGPESTSWFEFARAIFDATGADCAVLPGRTADLGRPAPRPLYSVLGTERADSPRLPSWRDGLAAYLEQTKVS